MTKQASKQEETEFLDAIAKSKFSGSKFVHLSKENQDVVKNELDKNSKVDSVTAQAEEVK